MMYTYFKYDSPVGELVIAGNGDAITHVEFSKTWECTDDSWIYEENTLICNAYLQLEEYFIGKRKDFDLKLNAIGTDFQMRVWKALYEIPYGETRSYKDIAIAAGSPKGYRAVGMANHNNPISIIIPCHRVIGANKTLVGYGGGLDIKEKLLELEQKYR